MDSSGAGLLKALGVAEFVREIAGAFADGLGGDAADEHIGFDIFGDDRSAGDHGSFADRDAREDGDAGADVGVILDFYGAAGFGEVGGIDVVLARVDADLGGDVDAVADGDAGAGVIEAVIAERAMGADCQTLGTEEAGAPVEGAVFGEFHAGGVVEEIADAVEGDVAGAGEQIKTQVRPERGGGGVCSLQRCDTLERASPPRFGSV